MYHLDKERKILWVKSEKCYNCECRRKACTVAYLLPGQRDSSQSTIQTPTDTVSHDSVPLFDNGKHHPTLNVVAERSFDTQAKRYFGDPGRPIPETQLTVKITRLGIQPDEGSLDHPACGCR